MDGPGFMRSVVHAFRAVGILKRGGVGLLLMNDPERWRRWNGIVEPWTSFRAGVRAG